MIEGTKKYSVKKKKGNNIFWKDLFCKDRDKCTVCFSLGHFSIYFFLDLKFSVCFIYVNTKVKFSSGLTLSDITTLCQVPMERIWFVFCTTCNFVSNQTHVVSLVSF